MQVSVARVHIAQRHMTILVILTSIITIIIVNDADGDNSNNNIHE